MKILHISAECYPIAKVGGLADVVGALPKFQESVGITSQVLMPYYETKFTSGQKFVSKKEGKVALGNTIFNYHIFEIPKEILGFSLFLVKIEGLTDRKNVYGYDDDTERFTAFQKVAADFILESEDTPSIVHCHDHHTGLLPFFISYCHKYQSLKDIPTVITIHNAQYQGQFNFNKLNYFPEFDLINSGMLEWDNQINPLAAAIKCAWKVTTVSKSYLKELQEHANGLEGLLHHENEKSIGILNGVDADVWNPATDVFLKTNFNKKTVTKGRNGNKKWICEHFGLDPKLPLIAFIGRFVYEKGSDLLAQVIEKVFTEFQLNVSIVILGSGDKHTEQELETLKETFKGNFNAHIGYDEELSHIIYGGADFLLMPSRVEPCGLNQMYAMRYGMFPIVSNTGGLKDTIIDVDIHENGYGVICNEVSVHEISFAIQRAMDIYNNTSFFKAKQKLLMTIDNSWNKSAKDYINMYKSLLKIK